MISKQSSVNPKRKRTSVRLSLTSAGPTNATCLSISRFSILHQLVIDTIHQRLPAGFNDIYRDTNGSPAALEIFTFHQDPDLGSSAVFAREDTNLVIGEFHILQAGIKPGQGFAQGPVQGINRTVPHGCRMHFA